MSAVSSDVLAATLLAGGLSCLFVLARPRGVYPSERTTLNPGTLRSWRRPAAAGIAFAVHALIAAVVAYLVLRERPGLFATVRYIGGLFLITVAVLSIRRAPAPAPASELEVSTSFASDLRSRLTDLPQLLFTASLLPHLVEAIENLLILGLQAAGLTGLIVATTLVARNASRALAEDGIWGTRLRQGAGLALLVAAVYYAWP